MIFFNEFEQKEKLKEIKKQDIKKQFLIINEYLLELNKIDNLLEFSNLNN